MIHSINSIRSFDSSKCKFSNERLFIFMRVWKCLVLRETRNNKIEAYIMSKIILKFWWLNFLLMLPLHFKFSFPLSYDKGHELRFFMRYVYLHFWYIFLLLYIVYTFDIFALCKDYEIDEVKLKLKFLKIIFKNSFLFRKISNIRCCLSWLIALL